MFINWAAQMSSADGYGRNYCSRRFEFGCGGALNQVEHIRSTAATQRSALNKELSGVAEKLSKLVLTFPARAGETGKLYGSITTQMIADAIQQKSGVTLDRRQVDVQPIRVLGEHKVHIRLTLDLIPEINVIVHREGEALDLGGSEAEAQPEPQAEAVVEAPVSEDTPAE
jgi:large subunit ribosomal protein L9